MKHSWIMMMKKVSHVLDVEQAEETNNTNDEQETQQPDFMVEPAGDPAELFNDLAEMEITFESEDEEMSEYNELEPDNDT